MTGIIDAGWKRMRRRQRVNAEVRAHWDRVAQLGCIVTGATGRVTLHHCHGGSMREAGVMRSAGRKNSDWLVIPLDADLHVGNHGIDQIGHTAKTWEKAFGRQADHLDEVCRRLGVNVWERAGIARQIK